LLNCCQFRIKFKTSEDTILIYSVHLRSGTGGTNEQKRAAEIDSLRKITNRLNPGSNFIVCGDFNFYKSTEPAYQSLLINNENDEGHFIDPITMMGTWNNSTYALFHSQSTRTRQFGGGAIGGLDDRFDLMLFSQAISDSNEMYYLANTVWAVGNDGIHYNDSINKMPNVSVPQNVANALHYASDHLPVVSDFVIKKKIEQKMITINLKSGWNGISSYLIPINKNLDTILNNLDGCLITMQNQTKSYYPDSSNNILTQWDYQSGYFIKVSCDTSITFQGTTPIINSITILPGWNLISVLSETPISIQEAFKGNFENIVIIKDAVGLNVNWPEYDIGTLQMLEPKKGYIIKIINSKI